MTASTLSLNEQWLWLVENLTPGSIARTTATLGRRVRGPLDLDRLHACVTELIRRHDTLRTTFEAVDGRLARVVSTDPTPEWIWRDFSSEEPESDRESRALAYMDAERTKQIDIARGKQTRCMVARISPTEHLVLFATHHLAVDAASLVLLEEELSGLYRDGVPASAEAPLEPLPYREFIDWQNETLHGDDPGVTHLTELLRDADRIDLDAILGPPGAPAQPGYAMTVVPEGFADRQQAFVEPQLVDRIRQLMRTSRCSLYMVLLAALQLTLYLRSGSESFLVRSPSANRTRAQHRSMIGSLETQTFVKCSVDDSLTCAALIADVRGQVLSGLRHQRIPMSLVLGSVLHRGEAANTNAALAGGMVQFALFAVGRMADWPADLDVIVCAGSRIGTASDFQVFAMEEGTRLDGAAPGLVLEANNPGGVYPPESVQDFLGSFRDVLTAVAEDPDRTVDSLRTVVPGTARREAEVARADRAGERPATAGRDAAQIERDLLRIARSACGNERLAAGESVFADPRAAIDTAVRLVDAINGSAELSPLGMTIADLLAEPTVAGLAALLAERRPRRSEPTPAL
ncbi:condensation domain-containing protein [Solihabitans fulvus]|uniref:condensation domain-containing protein n=1 Tax=Solihabitans fulvus TaxID=1892852 RepID=UPI001661B240|nr:condensation domain-containing protein [Solihabitans fulvus]